MPGWRCFIVENTYFNAESDPPRRRHPDGAALMASIIDEDCSSLLEDMRVAAREAGDGDLEAVAPRVRGRAQARQSPVTEAATARPS